jgi:hypothetical protein
LSLTLRVGALRMVVSLGSFLKTSPSWERDLAIESREEVFAEAVYYFISIVRQCLVLFFLKVVDDRAIEPRRRDAS